MNKNIYILLLLLLLSSATINGQDFLQNIINSNYDSTYYEKLDDLLTTKVFTSSRLSEFKVNDNILNKSLDYDSKATTSLGVGIGYKWIGLSLAFNINNSSDINTGDTKWFNLQTQFYLRKFTIDLYSTINKGYYLENSSRMIDGISQNDNYNRGDITNSTYGVNGYYVFNSARYSNRATFSQNDWQKKTAGTFLAGGSLLYNKISADSSIVPTNVTYPTFLNSTHYSKSGYWGASGNIGYALTYVINKNWFFDANLLLGVTVGSSTIYPDNSDKISDIKTGLSLSNRFGIGYNSKLFYAAINYTNMQANPPLPINKMAYSYKMGTVQLVIAYRFKIPEHDNILPNWMPIEL